ncbi:MAG: T9SS type A sorting domain-containing protein, partial [Bacteroidota bacterium]
KLGDNLNSVCSQFPDIPNLDNCFSVRTHNDIAIWQKILRKNMVIAPGIYKISFDAAFVGGEVNASNTINIRTNLSGWTDLELQIERQWNFHEFEVKVFNEIPSFELRMSTIDAASSFALDNIKFEVKCEPCCSPITLISQPECLNGQQSGILDIDLNEPITNDMVESVFSTSDNFEYVDHIVDIDNPGIMKIRFASHSCSCEGKPFQLGIKLFDCEDPIFFETEPIACCESNCDGIIQDGISLEQECIVVNGNNAYEICFDFISDEQVLDISFNSDIGPCGNNFTINNWEQFGDDFYLVCGYLEIEDFDCISADVNIQTISGCCEFSLPLPWLEPCDSDDCVDQGSPKIELIRDFGSVYEVSISIPGVMDGDVITIRDNKTGIENEHSITDVRCGLIGVSNDGTIIGGSICNGVKLLEFFDCEDDNEDDSCFDYTLFIGDCEFILAGNYCDRYIVPPIRPSNHIPGRLVTSDQYTFSVYPNPASKGELINIRNESLIQKMNLFNLNGQNILSVENINNKNYQFESRQFENGLYLITIETKNQEVISKLISIIN